VFNRKYPTGTYNMLGNGKYEILPKYSKSGRIDLDQQLEPLKLEKPSKDHDQKLNEEIDGRNKDKQKAYDRMKRRADIIRINQNDEKKANKMLEVKHATRSNWPTQMQPRLSHWPLRRSSKPFDGR
jgi:hypothetical protein